MHSYKSLGEPTRDGSGGGKSQIVRTPLRVKHNSVGKPDWIFFARFESIYGRAKIFKQKNLIYSYIFYILNQNTVKSMGDFKEKKIHSGFPTLSCFTRSGVRTICDLPPPSPSLLKRAELCIKVKGGHFGHIM